jgi:hypothetical protein
MSRSPSYSYSQQEPGYPAGSTAVGSPHSSSRQQLQVPLSGYRSELSEDSPRHLGRRHSSPGDYSLTAALVSAASGAAAATLIDKHLVQRRRHHKRDHDRDDRDNGSEDEEDRHHGLRRLVDVAIGGYAGLGAYNYYQDRHQKKHRDENEGHHSHHQSRDLDGRSDDEDRDRRLYDSEDDDDDRERDHRRNRRHHSVGGEARYLEDSKDRRAQRDSYSERR